MLVLAASSARRDPVEAPPPGRPADGRRRDRARDPDRPRGLGRRGGRQPHRLPRQPRPRRSSSSSPGSRSSRSTCRAVRSRAERSAGRSRSRSASRSASCCSSAGLDAEGWLLGVALSTTALGTLVPILARRGPAPDAARLGRARHRRRRRVLADRRHLGLPHRRLRRRDRGLLLLVFGAVVALAAAQRRCARARRGCCASCSTPCTRPARRPCACPCSSSPALVFLSIDVGFDFVLGAFAGGLVVGPGARLPGRRGRADAARGDRLRLPDPDLLRRHRDELRPRQPPHGDAASRLAALFLGLFVVVRGRRRCSGSRELGPRTTLSLALLGATGLPLIVAIVGIGIDRGAIAARRRRLADRRRDDLGARPAVAGYFDREPGIIQPG